MTKLSFCAAVCVALSFVAPAQAGTTKHAIANFASCAKPQYPQASLDAKHEGNVDLMFLVATDGSVKDAKIKTSSGDEALDVAARDAIKLCKFKPATKDGKPVEEWSNVRYDWTLK
jgi:D-alanyl-D-alanine endopeptidase (penicillin-binding protein 7)